MGKKIIRFILSMCLIFTSFPVQNFIGADTENSESYGTPLKIDDYLNGSSSVTMYRVANNNPNGNLEKVEDGVFVKGDGVQISVGYTLPVSTLKENESADNATNTIVFSIRDFGITENKASTGPVVTTNSLTAGNYNIDIDGNVTIIFNIDFVKLNATSTIDCQMAFMGIWDPELILDDYDWHYIMHEKLQMKVFPIGIPGDIRVSEPQFLGYNINEGKASYRAKISSTFGAYDEVTLTISQYTNSMEAEEYIINSITYTVDGNSTQLTQGEDGYSFVSAEKNKAILKLPKMTKDSNYVVDYTVKFTDATRKRMYIYPSSLFRVDSKKAVNTISIQDSQYNISTPYYYHYDYYVASYNNSINDNGTINWYFYLNINNFNVAGTTFSSEMMKKAVGDITITPANGAFTLDKENGTIVFDAIAEGKNNTYYTVTYITNHLSELNEQATKAIENKSYLNLVDLSYKPTAKVVWVTTEVTNPNRSDMAWKLTLNQGFCDITSLQQLTQSHKVQTILQDNSEVAVKDIVVNRYTKEKQTTAIPVTIEAENLKELIDKINVLMHPEGGTSDKFIVSYKTDLPEVEVSNGKIEHTTSMGVSTVTKTDDYDNVKRSRFTTFTMTKTGIFDDYTDNTVIDTTSTRKITWNWNATSDLTIYKKSYIDINNGTAWYSLEDILSSPITKTITKKDGETEIVTLERGEDYTISIQQGSSTWKDLPESEEDFDYNTKVTRYMINWLKDHVTQEDEASFKLSQNVASFYDFGTLADFNAKTIYNQANTKDANNGSYDVTYTRAYAYIYNNNYILKRFTGTTIGTANLTYETKIMVPVKYLGKEFQVIETLPENVILESGSYIQFNYCSENSNSEYYFFYLKLGADGTGKVSTGYGDVNAEFKDGKLKINFPVGLSTDRMRYIITYTGIPVKDENGVEKIFIKEDGSIEKSVKLVNETKITSSDIETVYTKSLTTNEIEKVDAATLELTHLDASNGRGLVHELIINPSALQYNKVAGGMITIEDKLRYNTNYTYNYSVTYHADVSLVLNSVYLYKWDDTTKNWIDYDGDDWGFTNRTSLYSGTTYDNYLTASVPDGMKLKLVYRYIMRTSARLQEGQSHSIDVTNTSRILNIVNNNNNHVKTQKIYYVYNAASAAVAGINLTLVEKDKSNIGLGKGEFELFAYNTAKKLWEHVANGTSVDKTSHASDGSIIQSIGNLEFKTLDGNKFYYTNAVEYYLVQTKAPEGYQRILEHYHFYARADADTKLTAAKCDHTGHTLNAYFAGADVALENSVIPSFELDVKQEWKYSDGTNQDKHANSTEVKLYQSLTKVDLKTIDIKDVEGNILRSSDLYPGQKMKVTGTIIGSKEILTLTIAGKEAKLTLIEDAVQDYTYSYSVELDTTASDEEAMVTTEKTLFAFFNMRPDVLGFEVKTLAVSGTPSFIKDGKLINSELLSSDNNWGFHEEVLYTLIEDNNQYKQVYYYVVQSIPGSNSVTYQNVETEGSRTVTITNELQAIKGSMIFELSSRENEAVADAKYKLEIMGIDGYETIFDSLITDENGQIALQNLKKGEYKLTEVEPATGYVEADEKEIEFEISANSELRMFEGKYVKLDDNTVLLYAMSETVEEPEPLKIDVQLVYNKVNRKVELSTLPITLNQAYYTLTYVGREGTVYEESKVMPTELGSYTATFKLTDKGEKVYEITDDSVTTLDFALLIPSTMNATCADVVYGNDPSPTLIKPTGGVQKIEYKQADAEDAEYKIDVPKNAGNYKVRVTEAEYDKYEEGVAVASFSITKKVITMNLTVEDKVYDRTNVAKYNVSLNDVVDGDTITVDLSVDNKPAATFESTNIGNQQTITFSKQFILTGAQKENYILTQPSKKVANITPKTIIATGFSVNNKQYDGGVTATVNSLTATEAMGMVVGDKVIINSKGKFANSKVENDKVVTITDLTLTGNGYGNYVLADTGHQTTSTANITKKDITISGITASNKVYDGTSEATLIMPLITSSTGLIGAEDLKVNATGVFDNKNSGNNKTVTISGLTLSGDDLDNYQLKSTGQQTSTKANITKKELVISGVTANDKVYDANTNATLNMPEVTSEMGLIGDEVVTVTATGTFESKNAGVSKIVSISGWSFAGANGSNYQISTSDSQGTTTASITKKGLTVNGFVAEDKIYDGTTNATLIAPTVTSEMNLITGDVLTLSATGTFENKDIGEDKLITISDILINGADANNYELTESGNQTETSADITKRTITVLDGITASDKIYDGNLDVPLTMPELTTTMGLVAGEKVSATAIGTAISKYVEEEIEVAITEVDIIGEDSGNYQVATTGHQEKTSVNIIKKEIVISGIIANDKVYDGLCNTTLDYSKVKYDGIISGDVLSVSAIGLFNDKNAGINKEVIISNLILDGTDVGNYKLATSNQQSSAKAIISQAKVSVIGFDISKIYNTTKEVEGFGNIAFDGLIADETATVNASNVKATYNNSTTGIDKPIIFVGDFTMSGITAKSSNYQIIQPTGITGVITKALGGEVSKPIMSAKTQISLAVEAFADPTQSIEYGISTLRTEPLVWQASPIFTGLKPNTTYYVFARTAENINYKTGTSKMSEAIVTESTDQIVGEIIGTVNDYTGKAYQAIAIYIKTGGTNGTVIGSSITGPDGTFNFSNLPYGTYSLVATDGFNTVTKLIIIKQDRMNQNITMLEGNQNTAVEILNDETPSVAAENLDEMFTLEDIEDAKKVDVFVEIKLVVKTVDESDINEDAKLVQNHLGNNKLGLYLDAKLIKTITGSDHDGETTIQPPTGKTLKVTIDLPVELWGFETYSIIRIHEGEVLIIPAEYDDSLHTITFEADMFSTYAITYTVKNNVTLAEEPTPIKKTIRFYNTRSNEVIEETEIVETTQEEVVIEDVKVVENSNVVITQSKNPINFWWLLLVLVAIILREAKKRYIKKTQKN